MLLDSCEIVTCLKRIFNSYITSCPKIFTKPWIKSIYIGTSIMYSSQSTQLAYNFYFISAGKYNKSMKNRIVSSDSTSDHQKHIPFLKKRCWDSKAYTWDSTSDGMHTQSLRPNSTSSSSSSSNNFRRRAYCSSRFFFCHNLKRKKEKSNTAATAMHMMATVVPVLPLWVFIEPSLLLSLEFFGSFDKPVKEWREIEEKKTRSRSDLAVEITGMANKENLLSFFFFSLS